MARQRRLKDSTRIQKTKHYLKPKRLTQYWKQALDNGHSRLTFEETARDLFERRPIERDIEEIRHCWHQSEKQLRRLGTCVILVTETYFEDFNRREPDNPQAIRMCIAGGKGCPAVGVRLLTMKGTKNDPMALAYLALRTRCVLGGVAAIEDRATIEWTRGKMSKRISRRIIDNATAPVLPYHETEFGELMDLRSKR
jgi:hypothetical protein